MRLMTAIALFEAGYIFKERNASFVPKLAFNKIKNGAYYFKGQLIKHQEEESVNRILHGITYDSEDDAWEIIDGMDREIQRFGRVSASYVLKLSGIASRDVEKKYGWKDLQYMAPMLRNDGRWYIDFPSVIRLPDEYRLRTDYRGYFSREDP